MRADIDSDDAQLAPAAFAAEAGGYRIELDVTGDIRKVDLGRWTKKLPGASTARSGSDARLLLELVPGWTNPAWKPGSSCEIPLGKGDGLSVEKPLVSGRFLRSGHGYRGGFVLNGDEPELVDCLLVICLGLLCEGRGDLLLHSSAVACGEDACLFLGGSGAGKTTIALDLCGDRTPLSVDRTIVRFGDDGTAVAYSTPFGNRGRELPAAAQARLGGLFFIDQAVEHRLLHLSPWEATRLLLAHAVLPSGGRTSAQGALEAAGRLADMGCCHRLFFKRDNGFWPIVERACGAGE